MSLSSGSPRETEVKDASLSSNDANHVTNDEKQIAIHSDFDANTPNAVIVASRFVDSSRCLDAVGTVAKLKSCLKSPVVKYPEKHVQFDHSIDDRSQSEQISSSSRVCGELNANREIRQKSKKASDQFEKDSRDKKYSVSDRLKYLSSLRAKKKVPTALPSSSNSKRSIQDSINIKGSLSVSCCHYCGNFAITAEGGGVPFVFSPLPPLNSREGIEARKKKISPYSDERAIRNNQPLQSAMDINDELNSRPMKFASSSPSVLSTANDAETSPLVLPCNSASGSFSSSAPSIPMSFNAEKAIGHGLTYASLQVLLEKVSEASASPTSAGTSLFPKEKAKFPGGEEEDSKLICDDVIEGSLACMKRKKLTGNIHEEPRRSQRIRAQSQVAINAVGNQKVASDDTNSKLSNVSNAEALSGGNTSPDIIPEVSDANDISAASQSKRSRYKKR